MKKPTSKITWAALAITTTFIFAAHSEAARVTKANNTQALIDTEGESIQVGSEFYSINSAGKKVSILVAKQVRGGKALMSVRKGRASVGDTLQFKSTTSSGDVPTVRRKYTLAGGVFAGYAMSNMSMSVQSGTSKEDITMKDTSFSLKVFADYDLSKTLTVRGATGYETFAAKGTLVTYPTLCGGSANCQANYNYLPLEGSLHYNFMTGKTKAWVGLGYSFLVELSRSVNVPNLNSESKTNQMILLGAGADFRMSGKTFIPVALEYATFPGSTNVNASAIYLRAGYGFGF